LNQILHVAEDTKPLVSLLLCQGAIQFFIIKAENDSNGGKRQIRNRTRERDFRRRFLKEGNLS